MQPRLYPVVIKARCCIRMQHMHVLSHTTYPNFFCMHSDVYQPRPYDDLHACIY